MRSTQRMRAARPCVALLLVTALLAVPAAADVRLPHVISSHMVLQRDAEVPVWGWAEPREAVTVSLGSHQAKATADAQGRWQVKLPPMKAGGPLEMTVSGTNTLKLTDILVGEVWVCSGQSNMEWGVHATENAQAEIAAAKFPRIRLFHVPKRPSGYPEGDVAAQWRPCSPQTIRGFSAVAYFFGREIHKELDVPVGLINTSWGGTRIEPWTPPAGFAAVPKLAGLLKHIQQAGENYRKALPGQLEKLEEWIQAARKALAEGAERIPPAPSVPRHPLDSHGALWYQGESNRGDGMLYHEKMKALILGWRAVWGQGDFPFYYVQLAPFRYGGDPLALPGIWEAQTATLALPNTGMAVTVDIGNVNDIHPRNKQDVGKRLALWALAQDYGRKDLVHSGPLYKSMKVEDGKVRVSFDHVGSGLVTRDGKPPSHFQVAGEDKKFVDAQATIDGDTVVVWSEAVPKPVAVRYAWHQLAEPNLANKEGLPASPFRTDAW